MGSYFNPPALPLSYSVAGVPNVITVTMPAVPVTWEGGFVGFNFGVNNAGAQVVIFFNNAIALASSYYSATSGLNAYFIGFSDSPSASQMATKLAQLINANLGSMQGTFSGPAVAGGATVQITDANYSNLPYHPFDSSSPSGVTFVVNQEGAAGGQNSVEYNSGGDLVVQKDLHASEFFGNGAGLTNTPGSLPVSNAEQQLVITEDGGGNPQILNAGSQTTVFGLDGSGNPTLYSYSGSLCLGFNGDLQEITLFNSNGEAIFAPDYSGNPSLQNWYGAVMFGVDGGNNPYLKNSNNAEGFYFDANYQPTLAASGPNPGFGFDQDGNPMIMMNNVGILYLLPGSSTTDLPTSDPHNYGQIWDNNGVLTRSHG